MSHVQKKIDMWDKGVIVLVLNFAIALMNS